MALPAAAAPTRADALRALERELAEVLAPARPGSPGIATGLAALDAALQGGLPRGRLTEIAGAPGAGTTSLVRHLVASAVRAGLPVAFVDATRTLAPRDWAFQGSAGAGARADARVGTGAEAHDALWVVRPADPAKGAWCADVLLRSGAFALVVVDGAPTLARPVAVRLTRLAKEADAALLVVGDGERPPTLLGGATRLRVAPARAVAAAPPAPRSRSPWGRAATAGRERAKDGAARAEGAAEATGATGAPGRRRFVVAVEKGGVRQTVEVECAVGVARRLCTHPEVPDRRGAQRARGTRGAAAGGGAAARAGDARAGSVATGDTTAGRPLVRKRRCAEPPELPVELDTGT